MKPEAKLVNVNAKEVSLCLDSNPPANRRTKFLITKNKDNQTEYSISKEVPTQEQITKMYNDEHWVYPDFKDCIEECMEHAVENTKKRVLIDSLNRVLYDVFYSKLEDSEKEAKIKETLDAFMLELKAINAEDMQEDSMEKDTNNKEKNMFEKITEKFQTLIAGKVEKALETELASLLKDETPVVVEPVKEETKVELSEEVTKALEELETLRKFKEDSVAKEAELLKAQEEAQELLKAEKEANELNEKITLAKESYSHLVGTPEEVGKNLYDISKSELSDELKDFVLKNLKALSVSNEDLTKELGSSQGTEGTAREELQLKAQALAEAKGISISKAKSEILEKNVELYNKLIAE